MFPKHHSSFRSRHKRSSALIITLAVLLLASAILLVFFNLSTLNRQLSFSSAGQYRADTVAHTALDTIVGDLRNEIVAGSTTYTTNSISIYVPTTNQTVEPYAITNSGSSPAFLFTNLVTQSTASSTFWSSTAGYYDPNVPNPVRSAPGNNTLTPSLNGHYIAQSRWNKPGLLGDPGSSSTANNIPAAYVPPDWVMVTRNGAVTNAGTITTTGVGTAFDLTNKNPANTNYVVGRYAYTIYNEGGLIDANVAGCPSAVAGTDPNTKRGVLPQMNLADLFTIAGDGNATADANTLVTWRNQVSAASSTAFTNYVYNATNGFTTVASGDQAFLSRQDLINYVKNNGISTATIPLMATFTRELNAPSYTPPPLTAYGTAPNPEASKPQVGPGESYHLSGTSLPTGVGTVTDYTFNPSLINTRVTTPFARYSDGTLAVDGEPLIKYRFPLSRLAWIAYNGHPLSITKTNGQSVTDADTQSAFGLTWNSTSNNWTYNHGSANRILTLAEVAAAGREPDFFELLQAAISIGSLGKQVNNLCFLTGTADSNPYYQVIQIGANLIDQADSDSYPTRIVFDKTNTYEFDGVENLPYVSRVFEGTYYHEETAPGAFGLWFIPEVWQPNVSTVGIDATHPGPTQFKFTLNSSSLIGSTVQASYSFNGLPSLPAQTFPAFTNSGNGISFTASPGSFTTPALLTPANASATGPNYSITEGSTPTGIGSTFLGIFMGEVANPFGGPPFTVVPPGNGTHEVSNLGIVVYGSGSLMFQLWYQYPTGSGNWIAYSRHRFYRELLNETSAANTGNGTSAIIGDLGWLDLQDYWFCSDPRTDRFGMVGTNTAGANHPLNPTTTPATYMFTAAAMRPAGSDGSEGRVGWPLNANGPSGPLPPGWGPAPPYCRPYMWSNNLAFTDANAAGDDTGYEDPDGVLRPADGAYSNNGNAGSAGYPLAFAGLPNATVSPDILNRPFRSVTDMGYAFRDEPWKHLDFFTSQSADAALLDLFCVNESPAPAAPTVSTNPVPIAGRVDLNTRQEPVLQALLTGAIQWDDGNVLISGGGTFSDATQLTKSLMNLTGAGTAPVANARPLLNRSELATRWMSAFPTTLSTAAAQDVKRQREAALRALSEVGNTRTWNLLIDVIAQSGRYTSAGGTDLNKQFIVEGERRYWLHVAIDRYTGKVIAQSLEPVYE
jgi:hypothetical protein